MIDLKQVLPLYIGNEIEYPDTDNKKIRAILTGVSIKDGIETTYKRKKFNKYSKTYTIGDYLAWNDNGNHKSNAFNIKLILRKLSSLTVEEFNNMPSYFDHIHSVYYPEQILYLTSIGVDVFNLIENGLAIEKK